MAKDHYIPAAFIGRFSADIKNSARERLVWVFNAHDDQVRHTPASNIGYKKNLYNLTNGKTVDHWEYEAKIADVLEALADARDVTLDDWIHVAVPFVTGLFVRGKEFNKRYEAMPIIERLQQAGNLPPENTNGSRILRMQRMLAPIAGARWVVLHNQTNIQLVTNDLGLMLTQNSNSGEFGWAIPLDTKTSLGIFPKKLNKIAEFKEGTWYANIEHVYPDQHTFNDFNEQMAHAAYEFIAGPDQQTIQTLSPHVKSKTGHLADVMELPWSQFFSREEFVAHEMEWRIIASIANLNLTIEAAAEHEFKLSDLNQKKWQPPILFLPGNLTSFPSGVCFKDNCMYLNLNLLDDFKGHIVRSRR